MYPPIKYNILNFITLFPNIAIFKIISIHDTYIVLFVLRAELIASTGYFWSPRPGTYTLFQHCETLIVVYLGMCAHKIFILM